MAHNGSLAVFLSSCLCDEERQSCNEYELLLALLLAIRLGPFAWRISLSRNYNGEVGLSWIAFFRCDCILLVSGEEEEDGERERESQESEKRKEMGLYFVLLAVSRPVEFLLVCI